MMMNKYKLQYWIYACLNKKFGSEIKIHRDSLHSMYEVNRHSFEISTNTLSIKEVKNWLFEKFKESQYVSKSESSMRFFTKMVDGKEFVINFREQESGMDWKNRNSPVIILSIYAYKKNR